MWIAFSMDDTVAGYSFAHAEKLLAMYEAIVRERGEHHLSTTERAEYRALRRRLRGRITPRPAITPVLRDSEST